MLDDKILIAVKKKLILTRNMKMITVAKLLFIDVMMLLHRPAKDTARLNIDLSGLWTISRILFGGEEYGQKFRTSLDHKNLYNFVALDESLNHLFALKANFSNIALVAF